jgi:Helix-turn-helix domain
MTNDVTIEAPKTLSVPQAGRKYFDLSRGAAYAAAARGDIPTIRIGRKLRVPIAALERLLERAGKREEP